MMYSSYPLSREDNGEDSIREGGPREDQSGPDTIHYLDSRSFYNPVFVRIISSSRRLSYPFLTLYKSSGGSGG